jgi:hypothetical protein
MRSTIGGIGGKFRIGDFADPAGVFVKGDLDVTRA